jgi:hypothetical protein
LLHKREIAEEYCKTPQNQQKEKGEQGRKKGKRINNSYCCFRYNDNCRKLEKHFRQDVAFTLSDSQKMTKVFNKREKLEKVSQRQNFCCYLEKDYLMI